MNVLQEERHSNDKRKDNDRHDLFQRDSVNEL